MKSDNDGADCKDEIRRVVVQALKKFSANECSEIDPRQIYYNRTVREWSLLATERVKADGEKHGLSVGDVTFLWPLTSNTELDEEHTRIVEASVAVKAAQAQEHAAAAASRLELARLKGQLTIESEQAASNVLIAQQQVAHRIESEAQRKKMELDTLADMMREMLDVFEGDRESLLRWYSWYVISNTSPTIVLISNGNLKLPDTGIGTQRISNTIV